MIQLKLTININFQNLFQRKIMYLLAINKGIKLATGDIISVLHSDDFNFNVMFNWHNNHEKIIRKYLRKYSPINFKKWMFYIGISPPHPSMFLKSLI